MTLIGWGAQHHQNMEAAAHVDFEVEVINLRTLHPLDLDTIVRSVRKTGRAVVAYEAPLNMGFGAEIVALLQTHCFPFLEAPLTRCAGLDTPFPNVLEGEYLPDAPRVKKPLEKVYRWN